MHTRTRVTYPGLAPRLVGTLPVTIRPGGEGIHGPGDVPPSGGSAGKHVSTHHQQDYQPSAMQYSLGDYALLGEWAAAQGTVDLGIPVFAYSSAFTCSDEFFTGITGQRAIAAGYALRNSSNGILTNAGYGGALGDPGSAGYQSEWASTVIAQIRDQDGAAGVFIDDLVQSAHITGGDGITNDSLMPALYPTQPQWRAAVEEFVSVVVPLLRNAGLLVMLNTGAWWPGHAGGGNPQPGAPDYDNGDGTKDWAVTLGTAGGVTDVKCMIEPGFQTVDDFPGTIRTMGSGFAQHWDGWADVITVIEAAGLDYVGIIHGVDANGGPGGDNANHIYMKASMLLWMNRPGSSAMLHCDHLTTSPFAGTKMEADLGAPLGAAQLSGSTWTRFFEDGNVSVNPFNQTAAINLT